MKSGLALPVYGAAGALTLLLAVEWLPAADPQVTLPAPTAHAAHGSANVAEAVARDTAQWAEAITSRPLFSIGRRPPRHEAGGHAVATTGLPRLSGIMITGAGRRAIFMPEGGKPMTLAEGAMVDEYTIRRITPDTVYLSGGKGDMALRPSYDPAHAGMTTAAPAPAFPQPGFTPPGFQPPFNGFNPGFQPPVMPPGMPLPAPAAGEDGEAPPAAPMPSPFPGARVPFNPRGRTQ
jgi:hypothetical protein